jgi:hypothetical protein
MGLSKAEILEKIGFEKAFIDQMVKDKKPLQIILFKVKDPKLVQVPKWEFIKEQTLAGIKADKYFEGELKALGLIDSKGILNTTKLDEYFEVLKATPPGKTLPNQKSKDFRDILQGRFGNNPLFTGQGAAYSYTDKFGTREFMMMEPKAGWNLKELAKQGIISNVEEAILP